MAQHIVIFGGSSGIGLQLTRRLLEEGNNVTIVSRNKEKLMAVQERLGDGLSVYSADANHEQEVARFFQTIAPIDHLISTMRGPSVTDLFTESQTTIVREAFDEKFWTQYHMVRHGLAKMKPAGSVILTSGIASQRSYPGYSWLAGANGAIESLVKSLCAEILPVRINVVSPGFVEKVPHDPERLAQIKHIEPCFPMERLATQDEVVESYFYLMKNGYTTGNTLVVDGGVLNT